MCPKAIEWSSVRNTEAVQKRASRRSDESGIQQHHTSPKPTSGPRCCESILGITSNLPVTQAETPKPEVGKKS